MLLGTMLGKDRLRDPGIFDVLNNPVPEFPLDSPIVCSYGDWGGL